MRHLGLILAATLFSGAAYAAQTSSSLPSTVDFAASRPLSSHGNADMVKPALASAPRSVLHRHHRNAHARHHSREAQFWADVRRHRAQLAEMFGERSRPAAPAPREFSEPAPRASSGCATLACSNYVLLGVGF
jgi:hypothetical protein